MSAARPPTSMYVGRFVVVAPTVGAYRVSSRSFPNRRAIDRGSRVTIAPTPAAEETDNPYVSYNCLRPTDRGAVIGNGSHVDPIAEKLALGYPARDALATALLALDFERDEYDTPRIAGVIGAAPVAESSETGATDGAEPAAYVGIVRRDGLVVERVTEPTLVATYERTDPEPFEFAADDAATAARAVYEQAFEHPICAAGVALTEGPDSRFETAIVNG